MLTNTDIEEICEKLKLNCIGVYSKDQLPKERRVGGYYINMEDSDKGDGSHWVFANIFPCGKAIYFDSFGIGMPPDIHAFLKPFAPIACSNRQIQDLKAETCGWFCIACHYYFTYDADPKKRSIDDCYDDFLNMWSWDTTKNNKILKEYLGIVK